MELRANRIAEGDVHDDAVPEEGAGPRGPLWNFPYDALVKQYHELLGLDEEGWR